MSEDEQFLELIHGRYRYVEEIGRGGMGRVVLVDDLRDDCQRALKWVDELGEASLAEAVRQLREFQILSRFQHPNFLRVYEYGRVVPNGGTFFTSEVLTGPTVGGLIGCSHPEVGRRLIVELFRGLAFLHRQGWVHGDIKPDNLRLRAPLGEPNDDLCILDLGLAHPEGRPPEEKILGTVHYMPPERLLGGRIDRRGDLYSAGVLAFQIVTGTLPFGGNRKTEVFDGHLRRPPPDPRQLAPETPSEIAGLLFALLEKRPEDRPNDAEEVLRTLNEHWDGLAAGPETTSTLVAHVRLREEAIWNGPVGQVERRVRERCGEGGEIFRQWSKTAASETSNARPMRAASISSSTGSSGMLVVRGKDRGDLRLFRAELLRRLQVPGHAVIHWNANGEGAHARLDAAIEAMTTEEMRNEEALQETPTDLPDIGPSAEQQAAFGDDPVHPGFDPDNVASSDSVHPGFDPDSNGFEVPGTPAELPMVSNEPPFPFADSESESRELPGFPTDSDSEAMGFLPFGTGSGGAAAPQVRRKRKRHKKETPQLQTLEALARVARHAPVVVVVDSAHGGTHETFSVLVEAIAQERRIPGLDQVFWVALADDRPGPWFSEWVERSDTKLWIRSVQLPRLDAEGVEAFLGKRFPGWDPEPGLCMQLLKNSGGSPSHLERILVEFVRQGGLTRSWNRWQSGSLPALETSRVVERARRACLALTPEERGILEALAVVDAPSNPIELQELAGSPPGKAPELLITLLQKRWLMREGAFGSYQFTRKFQAIAVESTLDPDRRGELHRRAAEILERKLIDRGSPDQWERLCRHRIAAGQYIEAWSPLIQFLEHSAAEGDPSVGIERAESFLQTDTWRPVPGLTGEHRGVLHDAIGLLRLRQGDVTGAERDWRQAERYFASVTVHPQRTGRLQTRLGSLLIRRGDGIEALPRLKASLKALRGRNRGDLLRRHLVLLAELNHQQGELDANDGLFDALDKLGPPENPLLDAEATLLRADHSIRKGHMIVAREHLVNGLRRFENAGQAVAGFISLCLGRLYSINRAEAASRQQYRLAATLFQRQQQPLWEARSLLDLAEKQRQAHLMADAERALLRADRQLKRSGGRSDLPRLLWLRSSLLADGGWVKEARASLIELAEWGDSLPHAPWRWEASLLEAELMLRMGNLKRTIQLLSGAAHPTKAPHSVLGDTWCRWSVLGIRLALRQGLPAEALQVSDEALAEARERCDAAGLTPIWRERIRTLHTLGCEKDAKRLEEQLDLPEEARIPDSDAGGEEFAEHLAALAREAEEEGEISQAAIHFEEALFHALRVRALPLGAILPLRLSLVRARDDRGSEMAARQAWRRLAKSDVRLGRVEVLCLWARARERAGDHPAAASLRRAAVREVARWSEKIPLEHDLLTLAKGLRVDRSVLEAIADAMGLEIPPRDLPADEEKTSFETELGDETASDEQPDFSGS